MAQDSGDNKHELLHDPKRRRYLPPFSHSPFGDFPPEYELPKYRNPMWKTMKEQERQQHLLTTARSKAASDEGAMTNSPRVHQTDFLHKRTGSGGLCASTMKGRTPPSSKAPHAGAFRKQVIPPTDFRRRYERGDLPITIQHRSNGRKLEWKVEIEKLDYHHYLPIFFDGLREVEEPYKFLASQGCYDLLDKGAGKILPTIPQLIIPMKTALNSRDPDIICNVLKVMQKLVQSGDLIGEALVPYYRQLLPVFNLFRSRNINLGDEIEYSQRKRTNLGDLITETLNLLERYGGEDAFVNIKYMIPAYESCVLN